MLPPCRRDEALIERVSIEGRSRSTGVCSARECASRAGKTCDAGSASQGRRAPSLSGRGLLGPSTLVQSWRAGSACSSRSRSCSRSRARVPRRRRRQSSTPAIREGRRPSASRRAIGPHRSARAPSTEELPDAERGARDDELQPARRHARLRAVPEHVRRRRLPAVDDRGASLLRDRTGRVRRRAREEGVRDHVPRDVAASSLSHFRRRS